jgi:hypothetical protein
MYRVFRFKKVPTYWPASSTVFVDYPTGDVEQYITDNNGTRTLVSSSSASIPANIKGALLAATAPSSTNRFVTYQEILGITGTNADWNATSGPALILNKPTIPSIAGLATTTYVDAQDALKVDKVTGKGLSTNDYTTAEQTKLAGIAAGAEVNVNADWNAVSGDAQILNKPTIPVQAVPVGGTAGQILAKIDATDFNLEWIENYANYTSTLKHTVKAGEAINKGQAVYVSSANGTNIIVSKASNTSEATSSKTMGLLAQTLANNGQGFVVTEGLLTGLNTNSANAGDLVWLGTNGNLIYGLVNKPYAPAHLVFIGIVTRAHATQGEIFVKVQNGFELKEIHDVDLITTTPSNNEVLVYETSSSLWKNKTVVSALGFTPYNDTNPSGYITSSALSTYVPYTGATGNVNLGANSLFTAILGVGISSSLSATAHVRGSSASVGSSFLVQNSTPANIFNVLNNGFVGIGTNTPVSLLHIGTGTSTTLGDFNTPVITFNTVNNGIYLDSNKLFFKAAGAFNFGIDSTGVLGTQFRINGGSNNLLTPVFVPHRLTPAGLASGFGGNSVGDISLITASTNVLTLYANTNIGIGSTTNPPLAKLSINHQTSYNGSLAVSPVNNRVALLGMIEFTNTTTGGNWTGQSINCEGSNRTFRLNGSGNLNVADTSTFIFTSAYGGRVTSYDAFTFTSTFQPTSGTAVHNMFNITGLINQTGTATGITRGLLINPTISATDYRGLEVITRNNANDSIIKLNNGSTDLFVVKGDSKIGFFGATPAAKQTLGAATAGMVYSTTEQTMLQNVYDLLKTFGLG